jgi:hypothetical protein
VRATLRRKVGRAFGTRQLRELITGPAGSSPLRTGTGIAVASAAVVTVVGLVGGLLGPRWHPRPFVPKISLETEDTSIGGDAPTTPVGTYETTETIVEVQLTETVTVDARILAPVGAPAGPGILFVHGAGTGRYDDAFPDQAELLATAGITTMVPNKRLDTYTTTSRDYVGMAADYLTSFEILRTWPTVDPEQAGIYAESEGDWIAPIMAADNPDVAFLAMISAPVVPPRVQGAYAADNYLRYTHVPQDAFRMIPRILGLTYPPLGFEYFDWEVSEYQRRCAQPIFMAYGTNDMSMPVVQAAEIVIADAQIAGSPGVTVRYYAAADHGIRVNKQVSAQFVADLARWIQLLPTDPTPSPQIAGDTPTYQVFVADPVAKPRWFANGLGFVAPAVVGVAGVAVAGLVGVGRLITRRKPALPTSLRGPLTAFAGFGLAASAGLIWYLRQVADLALNYRQNDLVVIGGWWVLRVLAIGSAVAGVVTFVRAGKAPKWRSWTLSGKVISGSAVVGGSAFVYLLAYWGVFPFGQ